MTPPDASGSTGLQVGLNLGAGSNYDQAASLKNALDVALYAAYPTLYHVFVELINIAVDNGSISSTVSVASVNEVSDDTYTVHI